MTKEQYERWSAPFRTPFREKCLNVGNRVLTMTCYITYPLTLLWLWVGKDSHALRALLVPAVSFVLLSLFRRFYNAKRPYEQMDIRPLIHKDSKGKSFPSRHVFSVFIIAVTYLWMNPAVGGVFLAVGVLLALCRVIGGVHYPRDVLAGALFGIFSGLLGYFWL